MKNPKKETRDVIAKHVRWTEALRVVRAYHPEVTIILPQEKTQIYPGDDVRGMIAPAVGVIRHALDAGVWQWHGYTAESRVKQVRTLLSHYFHYHEDTTLPPDPALWFKIFLFFQKLGGDFLN